MPSLHRTSLLALFLLALAGTASAATPAADSTVADCVDLGANHDAFRFGDQALLVADGDSHYKVTFGASGCSALMASSTVDIATDGQANRLCPSGSRVIARAQSCAVRGVQRISADEYTAYQRRARAR